MSSQEITKSFNGVQVFPTSSPISECLTFLPRTSACNLTSPSIAPRVATACLLTKCPRIRACNLIMPLRARNARRAFTSKASISVRYQKYNITMEKETIAKGLKYIFSMVCSVDKDRIACIQECDMYPRSYPQKRRLPSNL